MLQCFVGSSNCDNLHCWLLRTHILFFFGCWLKNLPWHELCPCLFTFIALGEVNGFPSAAALGGCPTGVHICDFLFSTCMAGIATTHIQSHSGLEDMGNWGPVPTQIPEKMNKETENHPEGDLNVSFEVYALRLECTPSLFQHLSATPSQHHNWLHLHFSPGTRDTFFCRKKKVDMLPCQIKKQRWGTYTFPFPFSV